MFSQIKFKKKKKEMRLSKCEQVRENSSKLLKKKTENFDNLNKCL